MIIRAVLKSNVRHPTLPGLFQSQENNKTKEPQSVIMGFAQKPDKE
jgi:hypothetical protein